jgi:hypothetical protein
MQLRRVFNAQVSFLNARLKKDDASCSRSRGCGPMALGEAGATVTK